ncbi:MAG: galactitol-1-phosphate 5-dehydrogenase [Anaerolineae bacterium]
MGAPTMQALVLHGIGDLRLERVPIPTLRAGEALVRVAAAGVCGSDVPRVFVHGTYRFPLIPGHEFAGVVQRVEGPATCQPGTRVAVKPLIPCGHCVYCQVGATAQCTAYDYLGSRSDGGWAEFVRVPQANLLPLPASLDLVQAALAEPAAVALHALRRGQVAPGDTVAILGSGPIGMMLARWANLLGAGQVLLVDIDPHKLHVARDLGLGLTCDSREQDPVDWAREQTAGRGPDLVIEAAGAPITFEQSLRMARPLGRVVIMGNPAAAVNLPQATISQVLRKELDIRGTWNSCFVELPVDEWRVVVDMMASRRLDVAPFITHRVPLAQGVQALEMMRDRRTFYNRVVLVNESLQEGSLP